MDFQNYWFFALNGKVKKYSIISRWSIFVSIEDKKKLNVSLS